MSILTKMLAVLDVFTPARPVASAEEIMAELDYSRGTVYRYIGELCAVGLLRRVGSTYTLGPKIIELDLNIRLWDPVLRAAAPVMRQLRDEIDCDVLLTSFYGDRVVVTHHERGTDTISIRHGRGRVMPLFRGAGTKPILANLPTARLKRLYAADPEEVAEAGLGRSWDEFRRTLQAIRREGYASSVGELKEGTAAVGAPLFQEPNEVAGSLVLVFSRSRYMIVDKPLVAQIAIQAARKIEAEIANPGHGSPLSLAAAQEPPPAAKIRRRSHGP